jgi:hypothetical protein
MSYDFSSAFNSGLKYFQEKGGGRQLLASAAQLNLTLATLTHITTLDSH